MTEEIRQEEAGQNFAVGESSVTLQTEFETEAATPGISLFVLLTAINYNLAIKCPTGGHLVRVSMTWENDEIHRNTTFLSICSTN